MTTSDSASFCELRDYVGFTSSDSQQLSRFARFAEPHFQAISNRFYDAIDSNPSAARVVQDPAQGKRLRRTLVQWMDRFLKGPHDARYCEERRAIGRRHVDVQLPQRFMFTGMSVLRSALTQVAFESLPADDAQQTVIALSRLMDIELAIMVETYSEVRDQRRLRDLRELIVSNLPLAVLVLDESGKVVAHTSSNGRLWPEGNIVGRDATKIIPHAFTALVEADLRQTAKHVEIVHPRVDVEDGGATRSYRLTVVPLDHEAAAAMIHVEELTEAIEAEARAQRAERLAQLGTMSAQIAHEVRNPLAGISGTMQVLLSSMGPEDSRMNILSKVQEQILRLDMLVTDLLGFARPVHARSTHVDLAGLAKDVTKEVNASGHGQARVEGIGHAFADVALVAQVLTNIVQNAWEIGASRVVVKIGEGLMEIYDDGPGIPEAEKKRVFDPFYTTRTKGTGLGLPVALRAVEAQNGTISVGASPLGGAKFTIHLPAAASSTRILN